MAVSCTTRPNLSKEELALYETQINAWHAQRIESVKSRDGWLNLLGLYWLEPGINTFGTSASNQIVFPEKTVPTKAGYFLVIDGRVEMHLNDSTGIRIQGAALTDKVVFNPDSVKQPLVLNDRIAWNIIRRDGKFGVRVRDLTMQGLKSFHGIERFPIDPQYRVQAGFQPSAGRTIDITNVLGQTVAQASPGTLVFNWNGKEYKLDVLEGGPSQYFVIIADETSGRQTYAGGRYLYVDHEDANGIIVLDFNKAYNPPCVFTPYATCPLPPRQNVLPFSIYAGEKNYAHESQPADSASAS